MKEAILYSVTGNITSTHQDLRTLLWYNLQHTKGTSIRTRSQNTRYMAQSNELPWSQNTWHRPI